MDALTELRDLKKRIEALEKKLTPPLTYAKPTMTDPFCILCKADLRKLNGFVCVHPKCPQGIAFNA